MTALVSTVNAVTMTSREIAELTGKRHADVLRDVRVLVEQLQQNADLRFACASTTYAGENGQRYPHIIADEIGEMTANEKTRLRPKPSYTKAVIPAALRTKVLERDAYRCVYCKTHVDLCVDHIKPESKGGALTMMNLQTLCRSCNSIKGAKE